MALLAMALLTMALLTMALLTHCGHILTTTLPTMVQADFAAYGYLDSTMAVLTMALLPMAIFLLTQADFAAYGIALTFTPCALREVARRAATQGTGAT
eukprot:scaffold48532_cov72-Phaeocystis_antarctica.AAC.1